MTDKPPLGFHQCKTGDPGCFHCDKCSAGPNDCTCTGNERLAMLVAALNEDDALEQCLQALRMVYANAVTRLASAGLYDRTEVTHLVCSSKWIVDDTLAHLVCVCSPNADAWRGDLGDEHADPGPELRAWHALCADVSARLTIMRGSNGHGP